MQLSDFDYHLPEELIAQTPIEPRDSSRLLKLKRETGLIEEALFKDIINNIGENDVLVLNKTKVINARLNTKTEKGKNVEIFLHRQINENTWDCLVYPGKRFNIGSQIQFDSGLTANIKELSGRGRIIEFNKSGVEFLKILEQLGEIPLPPYIKEKLENDDRYQTVFSEVSGSVAAPTAGLHFTDELIEALKEKGVQIEKVLLHIGIGTFMGVETENILEHKMHSEYIEIELDTADRLNTAKQKGKRIIAVGTTSIRVLESFADETGLLLSGSKDTNIFIYPGYKWKFVDAIITNFHLPKSTLLMLISSFAGKELIDEAYKYAVNNKFRFFSFGDAMFIE